GARAGARRGARGREGRPRARSLPTEDHQSIGAGLGDPDLAGSTVHLPDVRAPLVAREGLEALGLRVEPDDRVRAPLAQPHLVLVVDINRVGLRPVARQLPRLPGAGPGIVATDVPGVPLADPDQAARVRPNTSRALSLGRRLDDRDGAGLDVDPRDVTAREGGVVDGAVGGRRDAIGPTALGRVPDLH